MNEDSNDNWCCIDSSAAQDILQSLPQDQVAKDTTTIFRVLGEPSRYRIVKLLQNRSLCVNDMCQLLGLPQSNVSHQLKVLRQNRLVSYARQGKMAMYSLMDEHVSQLIAIAETHSSELYQ